LRGRGWTKQREEKKQRHIGREGEEEFRPRDEKREYG